MNAHVVAAYARRLAEIRACLNDFVRAAAALADHAVGTCIPAGAAVLGIGNGICTGKAAALKPEITPAAGIRYSLAAAVHTGLADSTGDAASAAILRIR